MNKYRWVLANCFYGDDGFEVLDFKIINDKIKYITLGNPIALNSANYINEWIGDGGKCDLMLRKIDELHNQIDSIYLNGVEIEHTYQEIDKPQFTIYVKGEVENYTDLEKYSDIDPISTSEEKYSTIRIEHKCNHCKSTFYTNKYIDFFCSNECENNLILKNVKQHPFYGTKNTYKLIKCECGADKCSMSIHSDWCPKYNL